MISGAVNFLFLALVLVLNFAVEWIDTSGKPGMLVVAIMTAATLVGVILIVGAWQMLRLRSYGWAVACSVLALLPLSAGFMLGVPMGIWALFVLNRSDVQKGFAGKKKEELGKTKHQPGTLFGISMKQHVMFVGILRIAWGGLGLLIAVVAFALFTGPGIATGDREAMAIMTAFGAALAILPLALSVPDIIGGVGLLKHRPWARILVLIMAVIDLPFIPIGTAIGIYTIFVLMKAHEDQLLAPTSAGDKTEQHTESQIQQVSSQKRFSRTAIVGACLLPLVLILVPVIAVLPIPGPAEIMLVLLGVLAVFGTTILGIVSIIQIRHSEGRLYGMGLALFDALLLPLLALSIGIIAVCVGVAMVISGGMLSVLIMIIFGLIICVPLDFFLIRWACRKANATQTHVEAAAALKSERRSFRAAIVEACCGPKSKIPSTSEDRIPAKGHFSRTAIVGASLSALALFWIPAGLIYVGEIIKSDLQEFIMWVCILIGSAPVFGTTILGMVSVSQIRNSSGRLYGMGLALFDTLLFPLLLLNTVIVLITASNIVQSPLGHAGQYALLIAVLACPVLDFFIIRWAWRKANAGLEPLQSQTDQAPQPEVKAVFPQRPVDLSKQGKWNGFCIAALLISLVGGLMSIREIDPGDDVRDRIIWAASVVLSIVFACIGLWQHSKYQGMKGKGFVIAALVIALAALVGFFVTLYYPVSW
jgi:hypothetical protein